MALGVFKAFYADLAFQLGRKTSGNVIVSIITLVSNLVFAVALIRSNGLVGAAQAAAATFTFGLLASLFLGRSYGKFSMPFDFASVAKIALCTILMVVAIRLCALPGAPGLLLRMIIGIGAYGVAALAFNVLNTRKRAAAQFEIWMKRRERNVN